MNFKKIDAGDHGGLKNGGKEEEKVIRVESWFLCLLREVEALWMIELIRGFCKIGYS